MYNASKHMPCFPSCNVEGDMLRTLGQIKALNPNVKGVVYLNTLMAFPFYALSVRGHRHTPPAPPCKIDPHCIHMTYLTGRGVYTGAIR